MKTLFDVSYAKFYDNYYVVYSTCFNKFNCNDTFKYINAKTFIKNANCLKNVISYHNYELQLIIYIYFYKNGDTATTLAKKKADDFYKKILNIIHQIDNGNNIIW